MMGLCVKCTVCTRSRTASEKVCFTKDKFRCGHNTGLGVAIFKNRKVAISVAHHYNVVW
jgi:hypothetical protein